MVSEPQGSSGLCPSCTLCLWFQVHITTSRLFLPARQSLHQRATFLTPHLFQISPNHNHKPQPLFSYYVWPGTLCSSAPICPNLSLKSAPLLTAWAETLKDELLLKLNCPFNKEKSLYLILSPYFSLSGELVSKALENLHRIERKKKPAWNGVFNMENYSPSFQCQRYSFDWDWY